MLTRVEDSVESRLERLERQNVKLMRSARRAWSLLIVLSLAGGVTAIAGARQEAPFVTASGLTILGPNGKPRISLTVGNTGVAAVELLDAGGDSHISLQTDQQGGNSALKMRDIKDVVRVDLGINDQNAAGLVIDGQSH